jgi:hypothetical protein
LRTQNKNQEKDKRVKLQLFLKNFAPKKATPVKPLIKIIPIPKQTSAKYTPVKRKHFLDTKNKQSQQDIHP